MIKRKMFEKRQWGWSTLWYKEERNSWLDRFVGGNEFKYQVCNSWFAPVGTASDYPLLSKWVIYGEVRFHLSLAVFSNSDNMKK